MARELRFVFSSPQHSAMHKLLLFSALLALAVPSSSCLFRRSPTVFIPPPPQARPRRVPAPEPLPPPPAIAGDAAATTPPELSASLPEILELPRTPQQPAPRRPKPTVATAPPAPQPPEQPAPPKIGQIFTPDQVRESNRLIDESLERVRKALTVVAGKTLNAEQNEIANRVRTFQKQAEQAREQDLLTAVSLARRADLLAQDLLERLP